MFESSRPKVRWVSCWSPAKSRHLCFSSLLRLRFYMIFKVIGLWLRLLVDESWWKRRSGVDWELLVTTCCILCLLAAWLGWSSSINLSHVFCFFHEFSLEEKHLICFRVLHMFFKRPAFAMTIYNLPRKLCFDFPCSSCTRKTWTCQPLWRLVSPLMRTFSTTGRMVANIMVINDKHWQTYYGIDVCIDNLILPSFTL